MNDTIPTTPAEGGSPTVANTPAPAAVVALRKPVTYEECVSTIDDAKRAGTSEMKDSALDLLRSFFEERIAKKTASNEKDSGLAVRRSAMAKRTYTPYSTGSHGNGPKV